MTKMLRIGIAGLGTVGGGTVKLLHENALLLEKRCGKKLALTAFSARDEDKARKLPLGEAHFHKDALALAEDPEVDVVVEMIGGEEGIARKLVEKTLSLGKPVVTANKALLAHHGAELSGLAEKTGATLAFEAAVAGGIPIIKSLRDGLAANRFTRISGILNGTCNYILTRMEEEKLAFDAVLKDAQKLGYAEAEPSFDIDGKDAAHKISLLASLAYGAPPDIASVQVEGIRRISLEDTLFARELGYAIRLLGICELTPQGLSQRIHPALVPLGTPLAGVKGPFNAIAVEGNASGTMFFEGQGAGASPTASSVVADLMDIARGINYLPFILPVSNLSPLPQAPLNQLRCAYYVRLMVEDKPGVLADATGIFRDAGISVQSFIQHPPHAGQAVPVVITTHITLESAMNQAIKRIKNLASLHSEPLVIRIAEV